MSPPPLKRTRSGNDPVFVSPPKEHSRKDLVNVTKDTLEVIPYIIKSLEALGEAPRASMVYEQSEESCPPLDRENPYFPDQKTDVRVVLEDTFDAALALGNMHQYLGSQDRTPVCVLNFANKTYIGGGFYTGSKAQEEDLCRRSTLIETLHPQLYPMDDDECIYSPSVFVFRENASKNHKIMWTDRVSILPEVSVISMAAEQRPTLNRAGDDYANSPSRELMKNKMRLILRVAANSYHRRLVLGAIGCGAFGHPSKRVAELWLDVLSEEEFGGWFETIVFAVWDPKPPHQVFKDFYGVLAGQNLWQYHDSEEESEGSVDSRSGSDIDDGSDEGLEEVPETGHKRKLDETERADESDSEQEQDRPAQEESSDSEDDDDSN
ncbi:hypothetical protein N7509_010857 [Penicillium cosmopolitanum]|uniref:Microbial-type PARG catalytic domain-containing protein n=1 Tax=Penicillium cosmopolitanum TaxID=1131564 RepID=A0A9W9VS04_9EURO|nr:uncharacterized protein N7509_010857 [Penicillium cosmopolitanum]KAJ5388316.1 hypothetical protein N7509_010857 [Penicillium cosmopolitanum]